MDADHAPWVLRLAVRFGAEQADAIARRLEHPRQGDLAFAAETDLETGELLLLASSEEDLVRLSDVLVAEFGKAVRFAAPEVIYREALKVAGEIDYTYHRRSDDEPRFAHVHLAIAPGEGYLFENRAPPGALPAELLAGIERGFRSILDKGPCLGFPILGLRATLLDAEANDRSSPLAFEIATRAALRDALRKTGSILMEPIMSLAVEIPERFTGIVAGDLTSRRGTILRQEALGQTVHLHTEAPLSNLFGYANSLRSYTEGAGNFTQAFSRYAPSPPDLGPGGPDDFRPAIGMRA